MISILSKITLGLIAIFVVVVIVFFILIRLNGSLKFITDAGLLLTFIKYYNSFENWMISDQAIPLVLAFVPGILGISYPLIIQTISSLNDKYQSTHIVNTFKEEFIHKRFITSLWVSVLTSILAISKTHILVLLSLTSVIYLLFIFFRYISLLLTYLDAQQLFVHFSNRVKIPDDVESIKKQATRFMEGLITQLWHPIVDLLQYAIIRNDTKLYFDCKDKLILKVVRFYKYGPTTDNELLNFPPWLFNSTYDIVVTGIKNDDDNYYQNYELFAGSVFFDQSYSDEARYRKYHPNVYNATWRNLSILIEKTKTKRILSYWESAHQHWSFKLRQPSIEFDENFKEKESSRINREKVKENRFRALEFHTAFGAYLMHKGNYEALFKIWYFTQSQPPSYVLVPLNFDEIFKLYFHFLDDDPAGGSFLIRYWFKDLSFDAMNNTKDVKAVARRYICLLFLKQWIAPSWYGEHKIHFPQIPTSNSEKNVWLTKLPFIKKSIEILCADAELAEQLRINQITRRYCRNNDLLYPLDYLQELKRRLEQGFQTTLNDSELNREKIQQLDDFTSKKIEEAYSLFKRIGGDDVSESERDPSSNTFQVIRGIKFILDKEAFIENSSVSYLNFYTSHGDAIFHDYIDHVAIKFFRNASITYEVPNGKIFEAIDKLNLNSSVHVIIAFNTNLLYLRDFKGVAIEEKQGDEDFRYKSIPIFEFHGASLFVDNTVFVLRKSDLPMIRHKNWKDIQSLGENEKQRWNEMQAINENLSVYRKIFELNKEVAIREQLILKEGKQEEELRNKLLIDVDFLAYCWFRKGIKMISIQEGSMFKEGGRDDMDKIRPFDS